MGSLNDNISERALICLWGPPKSGKTVLASQFPNPFFVDIDHSLASVRALKRHFNLDFDFDVIALDEEETTDEDFLEIIGKSYAKQSLWTKYKKLINALCRKLPQDTTLVIDNMSRLSESLISYLMTVTKNNPLQIQDWGKFVNEMTEMAESFWISKAKCDIIIIAHDEDVKNELTGETKTLVWCPTKFRRRLPTLASDFLYMDRDIHGGKQQRYIERILQAVPDPTRDVGTRTLLPNISNPTYAKMRPYLEAGLNRTMGEPTWTPPDPEKPKKGGDNSK